MHEIVIILILAVIYYYVGRSACNVGCLSGLVFIGIVIYLISQIRFTY